MLATGTFLDGGPMRVIFLSLFFMERRHSASPVPRLP